MNLLQGWIEIPYEKPKSLDLIAIVKAIDKAGVTTKEMVLLARGSIRRVGEAYTLVLEGTGQAFPVGPPGRAGTHAGQGPAVFRCRVAWDGDGVRLELGP